MDRTTVNLSALSANLAPSLDLFADVVRNPAFAPPEVERVRAQRLAGIAAELTQPSAIALRTLPPLLYGTGHPYGIPFTGTGDPAVVAKVGRDDMVAFQRAWLRPDNLQMFVVSDLPAAQVREQLEAKLGSWRASGAKGTKNLDALIPPARSRIVLIDRPGSPQSVILAGQVLPVTGDEELIALVSANDVLGGNFLSRLNTDLREKKGWSYGVGAQVNRVLGKVPYIVSAPVQADSTGPAIDALRGDMREFLGQRGVTPTELELTINGSVRELPGSFETGSQVLSGMQRNALFGRPDDYYDTLADRYRALTAPQLDAAARAVIDPDKLLWVVVGDAAKVRPQLDALKLPVETVAATK